MSVPRKTGDFTGDEGFSLASGKSSGKRSQQHSHHDSWHDPPDPQKKAVKVDPVCTEGVEVLTDLLKHLNIDPYSEDEAELQFLYSKPSCFLILGKPGVGKTSLARRFAAEWKCQIINSTAIILENMEQETEMGLKSIEILIRGGAVPDEMVLKMIDDKVNSPEVAHHGYVCDDFPCLSEDLLSIQNQLELIKNWKLKPDFIINLKIPEKDIERRRLDQKIDPFTGIIYTKEVYDPEKISIEKDTVMKQQISVKEEDAAEDEEAMEEEEAIEDEDTIMELPAEIMKRLVKRPEDLPQQVADNLAKFRSNMLRILEDYMGDHDQQYLVELDGNLSVIALFRQLMQKLQTFVLRPAAVVTRITDPEDDELSEDMETEDLMRALGPKQMVAPRYRWRRSKWLRRCPVALSEGNVISGKPEFTVSFLDKVYCLSSAEALQKFIRNPRPYLVPKQPRAPCKISVVGQPFSGKTTLCHLLAQHYNAKVFDIREIAYQYKLAEKERYVEQVRRETTISAIKQVKDQIRAQLRKQIIKQEKERLAQIAAEAEALRMEQENEDAESLGTGETKKNKEEMHVAEDTSREAEDIKDKSPGHTKEQKGEEDVEPHEDTEKEIKKEKEITIIEETKGDKKRKATTDDKLPTGIHSIDIPEPEVDETHPEVKVIVNVAVSLAEVIAINVTPEFEAEVLEITIRDWEKELRSTRHDGPLHGCWILDNFPETAEEWNACAERNIIPDAMYVLGEEIRSVDNAKLRATCARYCLKIRDVILAEMHRRALEKELKNQEARLEEERKKILEEDRLKKVLEEEREKQRLLELEAEAAEAARQEALGLEEQDATTAETIPIEGESGLATPIQVPSNVLDEDIKGFKDEEEEEENEADIAPEKTELELLMEQPEAKAFMEKLQHFEQSMNALLAAVSATSAVVPVRIAFEDSTIEVLLETVVKIEEKPYKYVAWEQSQVDIDEEEEDIETEALEAENDEAADEKEEEEEEHDPVRGIKKWLGDTNYFDPVSLKETEVLLPGNGEVAAIYREKIYYFATSENRDRFLEMPAEFLSVSGPPKIPPLRLLVVGPRGSGKSLHGNYLAERLGIFHIAFRERLQELIIAKTKKKVGPEFEEDLEESLVDESTNLTGEKRFKDQTVPHNLHSTEDDDDDESDDVDEGSQDSDESRTPGSEEKEYSVSRVSFAHDTETTGLKEDSTKVLTEFGRESLDIRSSLKQAIDMTPEEENVELTAEEEAIKANLESNDPLPTDLLDRILKPYWTKEPYKSTGFILEGFPRTAEEAKYLQDAGLFPDAALILVVSENDVIGRLLPPKLDIWKTKRTRKLAKKARNKAKAVAKRNAAIAKQRETLIKERDERRASRKKEKEETEGEEDEEEEDIEEEEEDIEAILAETFEEEEEEEEEEDEELEEDAVERMKSDLSNIYADDSDRIAGVIETLEELLIPCLEVNAGRKPHIVRYIINKKVNPFVEHRSSIFERVYPISENLARRLIQTGYKQQSRFGRWDPVQLMEGNCMQPVNGPEHPFFICFYRSYIYYLSSLQNRLLFMQDPVKYLNQETPKPVVPLRIAIIGPPKSGKTTLANRFVEDYGIARLSIGEALRQVLAEHPKSELAQQIKWNLIRGRVVPDELQIQALDTVLLDVKCQTRGYVLDGYPMTLKQIKLMTEHTIIPVRVIELELNSKEVLVRGVKDRLAPTRTTAIHDSSQILAIKLSCYQRMVPEVRHWYQTHHKNYSIVPADQSKWWVVDAVHEIAICSVKRVQDYMHRTSQGKSAGIAGLCITPEEFLARIGDFGQYCPVSLAEWDELVDCSSNETLEYAAEFRGHYYKMAGPKELEMFLASPEKYVPPFAPRTLPPPEELPHKISLDEIKTRTFEILGYCPVTYLDGNLRYEALVPGNPQFAVEYKGKLYMMESEEKLLKFMKQPEKYANLTLPHKLPPAPEEMHLQNLPMLGFMEQTCAIAMVKALTAAGNVKPKYPFISSTRSALMYIAYHLKAFNPKSSPYIRKKYKQKLQQFQETCSLIRYLGNNMTVRYRDPSERPKDFDTKLETFFALRGIEPTPTWLK